MGFHIKKLLIDNCIFINFCLIFFVNFEIQLFLNTNFDLDFCPNIEFFLIHCFIHQQFNNFYISEHKNLLDLWREIGTVKRTFSEVKNLTSKDLTNLKGEIERCSDLLTTACQSTQADVIPLPSSEKVIMNFIL